MDGTVECCSSNLMEAFSISHYPSDTVKLSSQHRHADLMAEKICFCNRWGPVEVLGEFFAWWILHHRLVEVAPPALYWRRGLVKVLSAPLEYSRSALDHS